MKVQFKNIRVLDGVTFEPGIREVEDKFKDHWFLKGLINSGDVTVIDGGPLGPVAEKPLEKSEPTVTTNAGALKKK